VGGLILQVLVVLPISEDGAKKDSATVIVCDEVDMTGTLTDVQEVCRR
jgi:hypothetical protein